jgi:DNA-binding transcriptional LysR family regulator
VRAGVGIAMLFRCSVERELTSGELVELLLAVQPVAHPFYLIHNPRKRFSPVQLRLLDFLRGGAGMASETSIATRLAT